METQSVTSGSALTSSTMSSCRVRSGCPRSTLFLRSSLPVPGTVNQTGLHSDKYSDYWLKRLNRSSLMYHGRMFCYDNCFRELTLRSEMQEMPAERVVLHCSSRDTRLDRSHCTRLNPNQRLHEREKHEEERLVCAECGSEAARGRCMLLRRHCSLRRSEHL